MTTNLKKFYECLFRDPCLNAQDVVFNWPVKKDLPGTQKIQLPRIVVTPPSPTTNKSIFKKKKRPSKTCDHVAAKPKIVLDLGNDFWSTQPETPRARKQKVLFQCRNSECKDQFTSARQRGMHQGHCFIFDEVYI